MIITRFFGRGIDETIVRRAPKNKVYLVEAISFSTHTLQSQTVYVLNRFLKPNSNPIIGSVDSNITPNIMAAFETSESTNHWVGQIHERTKYISVGYENGNAVPFSAVVYGDIVSETKSNLLWEFISKRHR